MGSGRSAIWVLFSSVPCPTHLAIAATEGKLAVGLAEFVPGLVSMADRDLLVPRLLSWSWLALCASSRCSAAARLGRRALQQPYGW